MILIYEKTVTGIPTDNGLGSLVPNECKVTESLNGEFELSMKHPLDPDGKWLKITKQRILKVPTHRGDQLFRIYAVDTDILPGSVVVNARHIFYDLLDNFVETVHVVKSNGKTAGDAVLAACQYASGFTFASNITKLKTFSNQRINPVQALMGDIETSFIRKWGGEIARDNYDIAINTRIGADNGAKITYRKNMTGLKVTENIRDTITRIYPICQGPGNTIYILPEKYIDSALIANYPNPLVGTMNTNGITPGDADYPTTTEIYAEMRTQVAELYAAGIDLPKYTFEAKFVDLTKTEEYATVAALETIELGDNVTVSYSPKSINVKLRVVTVAWDALLSRYSSLIIGDKAVALSNHVASLDQRITNLEKEVSNRWFDPISKNLIPCYETQVQADPDSYNVALMQEGSIAKGSSDGVCNIGIGPWVNIAGTDSVAIGDGSGVTGDCSIGIGTAPVVAGDFNIAMGYWANIDGEESIAIGASSGAVGDLQTVVGSDSVADGGTENTLVGAYANSYNGGSENTLIGNNVAAGTSYSEVTKADQIVAVGNQIAILSGSGHIAIGDTPDVQGASDSIAIGHGAVVYGSSSIAIGDGATVGVSTDLTTLDNIAIGPAAIAKGMAATAVGDGAIAQSTNAAAFGHGSWAYGPDCVAIGANAVAGDANDLNQSQNVALGSGAQASGGDFNLAVGYGVTVDAVERNTAVGTFAEIAGGSRNVLLGPGYINGDDNIVIGNGIVGDPNAEHDVIQIGMSTGIAATSRPVIKGKSTEGISFMAQSVDKVPLRSELLENQTANAYSVLNNIGAELGGIAANGGSIKVVDQASATAVKLSISDLASIPLESARVAGTKYLVQPTDAEKTKHDLVMSQFESDGTYCAVGDASTWEDLRFPAIATKLGGSKDPGFAKFKDNGSGSQGVFTYWFDASAEEELYFIAQMPHSWKGTAIKPHVHWTPAVTADGTPASQTVEWGLEYTWADIGADFGNTAFVYGKTHSPADANVVAGRHYLTPLTDITPSTSQDGLSSMLVCRIFRNATDATDDTYEADAGLLEIDFHFEQDTIGSRTDTTK